MIVSRQNQKIKDIRRLRRCKDDRTVLEGAHLVGEALRAGLTVESILVTPEFRASESGTQLLADPSLPIVEVTPELIEYLADADSPRGVLAVVSLPRSALSDLPLHDQGRYLYVDGMQDPGNLGALARVAEAFGVQVMILAPGSVHPNHPRSLRASAGSLLRIEVVMGASAAEFSRHLKPVNPSWLVLTPRGGEALTHIDSAGAIVLALGAEGPGVSPEVLRLPHTRISIPVAGELESLNATVAAAIALYELARLRSSRD